MTKGFGVCKVCDTRKFLNFAGLCKRCNKSAESAKITGQAFQDEQAAMQRQKEREEKQKLMEQQQAEEAQEEESTEEGEEGEGTKEEEKEEGSKK